MTAEQQGHTPKPWKVFTTPDGLKVVGIGSEDGGGICDAGFGIWAWKEPEGLANAELIVRAVNCHDELLAALKTCREMVGHPDNIAFIDAAIAKATGGQS